MVTAMRRLWGEERTRQWLAGIQANEPVMYPKNTPIVAAVGAGEVDVGFVNHYYLHRFLAEEGESFTARNYHPRAGGPGALVMVSGAGILSTAPNPNAAERFIEFLLSPVAQQYFASQTFEYPLIEGVATQRGLVPLADLRQPSIPLRGLGGHRRNADPAPRTRHLALTMATIGRLAALLPGRRGPFRERRPRAPGVILGPAVLIAAVMVLPVVYLFVRATAGGMDAWALLARPRTALILARTLGLVGAVAAGAILIGVPVAWLTTRSDVPLRRVWAVVTALPLVLPSFVFGFVVAVALSPRGMLQQLLEGPLGVREIPSLFGFPALR